MNETSPSPRQWPPEIVRVTRTPAGATLYYPPLRAWRFALRLALFGIAMLVPAVIAGFAFAPAGKAGAVAILTFVLTAAFVYPLALFGCMFLLVALVAVSTSLTVEANAQGIRAARRVFGIKISDRSLPRPAIAVLEQETVNAPRGLGGNTFFRLVALAALPPPHAGGNGKRYSVGRVIVADGIPDEALLQSLEALIGECAQLRSGSA